LPTTTIITATRGTNCGTYPLPTTPIHYKRATPLHDHCLVAAGIHHASAAARE